MPTETKFDTWDQALLVCLAAIICLISIVRSKMKRKEVSILKIRTEGGQKASEVVLLSDKLFHPLQIVAKHCDFKALKAARRVSKLWNGAFEDKFRDMAMLIARFDYFEKPMYEFVNLFSPSGNDKSIPKNLWILKPKYLNSRKMKTWLSKYGHQLNSVTLGKWFDFGEVDSPQFNLQKKVFSEEHIQLLLTAWCPNLKVLKVKTPYAPYGHTSLDSKLAKANLECLELGSSRNGCYEKEKLKGTSRFLMDVLNCVKTVKTLRLVNISSSNLDGIGGTGRDYANGKSILSKLSQLDLTETFALSNEDFFTDFINLRKLNLGSPIPPNLKVFLTSVQNSLEELAFEYYFRMFGDIEECFPPKMEKLTAFKVYTWENPSLKFLCRFPNLKSLDISLYKECSINARELFCNKDHSDYYCIPNCECDTKDNSDNESKFPVEHNNLEKLSFRNRSEADVCFRGIYEAFPNLKILDIDLKGFDLDSALAILSKNVNLVELRIHLLQRVQCNNYYWFSKSDGFNSLQKLVLQGQIPLYLESVIIACLKACKVRELHLTGFEVWKQEYENVMEALSEMKHRKLKLSLKRCYLKSPNGRKSILWLDKIR